MFTGIIKYTGIFKEFRKAGKGGKIKVLPAEKLTDPEYGESIAVNGVCLTLEHIDDISGILTFHTLQETVNRTNLGKLRPGNVVNIERSLRPIDFVGGHLLYGHVDCYSKILEISQRSDEDIRFKIELPDTIAHLIVEKGCIAIDGISLTVTQVTNLWFSVNIIPVTIRETNLKYKTIGDLVNIETDMVARYLYSQLNSITYKQKSVTMETLFSSGWSKNYEDNG